MIGRSTRHIGLLTAWMGLAAPGVALGFSYYTVGGVPVVWNLSASTRYLSLSTFPSGSTADLQIKSAMGAWNLVPACDFQFSFARPDQEYPIDHFDGFNDTAAVPSDTLDPGVLGVTYLVNDANRWYDMDVLFSDFPQNVGYNFDVHPDCEIISRPTPTHGYSFLLIALHELGHALGMGHDPAGNEPPGATWLAATMNPRYPSGGPFGIENIIELHADDRSGARFLYPHSGPSTEFVLDIANSMYVAGTSAGKAVAAPIVPAEAYPDDRIVLRSTIENLGTIHAFYVEQRFYLRPVSGDAADEIVLGSLHWDLAFDDALSFGVEVDLPEDLPAGDYALGSRLDPDNAFAEIYEDNNHAVYCDSLRIQRLPPLIESLGQYNVPCGQRFVGPQPRLAYPLNMAPVRWSIDNPQPGMTISAETGVLTWDGPTRSPFPYAVTIRADNDAGSATQVLFLGVDGRLPVISPIPETARMCGSSYTGPTPQLTSPGCMNPIIQWVLDQGPAGMTISAITGVVAWPQTLASGTPHRVVLRALNAWGSGTVQWNLLVAAGDAAPPAGLTRADLTPFVACMTGPQVDGVEDCRCCDVDDDHDIDLKDAAVLFRTIGR